MQPSDYKFYSTLSTLPAMAQALLQCAGEYKIWCLQGPMGVGKTTLVKALCKQLGVVDHVTSPTFPLINEYATLSGEAVYHFDFYRLQHEEEALALDCLNYFDSGSYCFIEWPTKFPNLIPTPHCHLLLDTQPDDLRGICLQICQ